ncbi:YitT family protein [Labedella phragmitis]|uniref:YitT family protein n=1 Tax=Labedella phragmitis TaxID=2498849 RepID=A0A444PSY4_9MICO|nr:YitT family protein [Labedella phragmitis]RWZ50959.1 YitT family protein [Labedella phragmitis]
MTAEPSDQTPLPASPEPSPPEHAVAPPHSPAEDVFAFVIGTLMVSFGVSLLSASGAVTGGVAGIAILASYASQWPFGVWFVLINTPFFVLAVLRMGWAFTLKTIVTVVLVSLFSTLHPVMLDLDGVQPVYGVLFGSAVTGVGFIVLFRHRASVGGISILCLYLQDRFGWRAGYLQMGFDAAIVLSSVLVVPPHLLPLSIAGAVVMNLVIALNHRPNRYTA